ncbi:Nse4/EID protein, Nse3/MAGE-binding domain [Lasallia pustulata]|uniref:Non-structural maintenance of chromosomes element 4 n=1 Tax=Lasallia pustulata TaxID=136370 RepID=A0A1W5CVJ1_9LECA|nr:Nse4/EID protein, Nse3/MAGE-binding domain [Lasallia pustulata]
MARSARLSPEEDGGDNLHAASASTRQTSSRPAPNNLASLSPSPAASFSSDKENQKDTANASRQANSKAKAMAPPELPTPTSADSDSSRANKRRRLGERVAPNATQLAHQRQLNVVVDTRYYDPDQSIEERRVIRKGLRDLTKELNDSHAEYMQPNSTGLADTITRANEIYENVKQTSDAVLDSRLLVTTSDLTAKKTAQLALGDESQGVDVEDFISKCISFMRRGESDAEATIPGAGNPQRRRRRRHDDSDGEISAAEGSGDEGDALNWQWLGRKACFPNNVRPAVPGFLLGPLSVQKRARKQTQRRERLQKRDPKDAVRPEVLQAEHLDKRENSNLTTLCKNIRDLLVKSQTEGEEKTVADANAAEERGELTEALSQALMDKYGMADDGGVQFFRFVVNPKSFGQTVENLFYTSFLIRDGSVAIDKDSHMLPTLHATTPRTAAELKEHGIHKHQAVFHLDFPTWRDLVDTFDIKDCIIPHRQSDEGAQVGATGWYA